MLKDSPYLWCVLSAYVLIQIFKYLLEWLNIRFMRMHGGSVPTGLEGSFDAALLDKSQSYMIDRTRLGVAESVFMSLVLITFFFGGLLDRYNSWVASLHLPFLLAGWVFFLILSFAEQVLSTPFRLLTVFRLERRYGFATTTVRLWLFDLAKELILSTLILSILVFPALWLISQSPAYWWFWFWVVICSFTLLLNYISPYVIEPLFNKFTPLEDETLRERIILLALKAGISARKVLKMDASKRTRHSNAYFTGLGRAKRIVLFDTLLTGMSHGETLAVLAHEIGHWKRHHLLKNMLVLQAFSLAGLYLLFQITKTGLLSTLFRINVDTFFSRITLAAFLASMVLLLVYPLIMAFTRRMEKEADFFSLELMTDTGAGAPDLISALAKLSKDNLSNLHPHPLYVMFHYSHPPVLERIRVLREAEDKGYGSRVT